MVYWAIPGSRYSRRSGLYHEENIWLLLTSDSEQVYFKNNEMREMDCHFGDVYGNISDCEIEISHELAQYVLQFETMLLSCSDICGELDR